MKTKTIRRCTYPEHECGHPAIAGGYRCPFHTELHNLEIRTAEVGMLRGEDCLVDGDGPCGCCVKCLRLRAEAAEKERDALKVELKRATAARDIFKTGSETQADLCGRLVEERVALRAEVERLCEAQTQVREALSEHGCHPSCDGVPERALALLKEVKP